MPIIEERARARRMFIQMARRRQRPSSGSSVEFLLTRTANVTYPDLRNVLAPFPWAVIGAVATRLYMPERMTQDLNIALLASDVGAVKAKLAAAGCTFVSPLSIGGSSWRMPDGFPVNVIELNEPWAQDALSQAAENKDAQSFPVLPLPYLVLMKFNSGRVQDLADVSRMLGLSSSSQQDQIRAVFSGFCSEGLDDVESLLILGRMETEG